MNRSGANGEAFRMRLARLEREEKKLLRAYAAGALPLENFAKERERITPEAARELNRPTHIYEQGPKRRRRPHPSSGLSSLGHLAKNAKDALRGITAPGGGRGFGHRAKAVIIEIVDPADQACAG